MTLEEIKTDQKFWQRLMRLAGLYSGEIDGILGPLSIEAERLWEIQIIDGKRLYGVFDDRTESNLSTLVPFAQTSIRQWLRKVKDEGISIKVICGTRSYAEQNEIYAQCPKVTNAKGGQSWHNFGIACDFVVFKEKTPLWDSPLMKRAGRLASSVPYLEWGGDWTSFVDIPHVQVKKFTSLAEARKEFERA